MRLLQATAEKMVYETVKAEISCSGYSFHASGKIILQPGFSVFEDQFRKRNALRKDDEENDKNEEHNKNDEKSLPKISEGQLLQPVLTRVTKHFTAPPKRYTEAALLAAIDLVVGRRIDADILRYVPDIKDNPHVQEGITALISLLPDFPIEGKEQIHQMPVAYQRDSAGTLAQALDQFMYGIDPKAYEASGVSREGNIQRITDEIRQGQVGYLKEYLQEIVYDTGCSHDLQVDARNLMQRMSKYEKENPIFKNQTHF